VDPYPTAAFLLELKVQTLLAEARTSYKHDKPDDFFPSTMTKLRVESLALQLVNPLPEI
jgi:hypothetical protein